MSQAYSSLFGNVLSHPDDDEPRLVLADWLQERGDPRGEFIHLQCQLAAGTNMPKDQRAQLEAREQELLLAHEKAWLEELGLPRVSMASTNREHLQYGWARGFVEELELSWKRLEQVQEKLGKNTIVRDLRVVGLQADGLALMLTWPWLGQLRELELSNNQLGDEGAIALAQSPLRSVRVLDLTYCRIGDAGAIALAQSPALADISELYLNYNRLTSDGIARLRQRFGGGVYT